MNSVFCFLSGFFDTFNAAKKCSRCCVPENIPLDLFVLQIHQYSITFFLMFKYLPGYSQNKNKKPSSNAYCNEKQTPCKSLRLFSESPAVVDSRETLDLSVLTDDSLAELLQA